MMKKTLCINNPGHLQLCEGYILYTPKEQKVKKEIPIQDIAYLILEHPHITLSQSLLVALTKAKVAVMACDEKHLPIGLMLPIVGHCLQAERVRYQCTLSEERKALLWQQIIRAKINNQADVLKQVTKKGSHYLREVSQSVSTDNATHKEAQAARYYWGCLFGSQFRRERLGRPPNPALNYGYALLRSAIARALACQGLNLSMGIHHHNRYNPFALVDDMMEPYRSFVDLIVYQRQGEFSSNDQLTQPQKRLFIDLLAQQCGAKKEVVKLYQAIGLTASSYIHILQAKRKNILFPYIIS